MANVGNVYLGVNGQAVDLYSAKKMYVGFNNKAVEIPLGHSQFDYKTWLASASLSATGYASLDAVLADEVAVRKLMTIHAAVDYLASWKTTDADIVKILNNDICAKWITLRDYALDTLYREYATLMDSIDKFFYGEWALMPQVPVMTSNTAPYGTAIGTQVQADVHPLYYAFDNNTSTSWYPYLSETSYIGYHFVNPVKISKVVFTIRRSGTNMNTVTLTVQGSNDNSTWTDLSSPYTLKQDDVPANTNTDISFDISSNNTTYEYYRVYIDGQFAYAGNAWSLLELQFYAWQGKGNVPVMTSNTAPYGEVVASGDSSGLLRWNVFDGSLSTRWETGTLPAYVGYHSVNPCNIRSISFNVQRYNNLVNIKDFVFQGSNDGTNWTDIYSDTVPSDATDFQKFTYKFTNNGFYLYHRIYISTTYSSLANLYELQFYGRELKVSVPTMTSNTAPWGVASANNESISGYEAYHAFDGDTNTGTSHAGGITRNWWVQYQFVHDVRIRHFEVKLYKATNIVDGYIAIESSLDGTNWTLLHDIDFAAYTNSTWVHGNVDSGNAKYIRVREHDISTGQCNLTELRAYGENYSEYDWDTTTPRHYLYDHGVELETIGWVTEGTGVTLTKEPSYLLMNDTSTSYTGVISVQQDFSTVSIIKACADNISYIGNNQLLISGDNTIGGAIAASRQQVAADFKYNLFLPCSQVNNTHYAWICASTRVSTGKLSISEWWLE